MLLVVNSMGHTLRYARVVGGLQSLRRNCALTIRARAKASSLKIAALSLLLKRVTDITLGYHTRVRIDVGFSMRDPNRASPVMRWAAGLPTFDILQVSQQEEYAGTSKRPGYHSPRLPGTRNLAARRVSGLSRE